MQRPRFQDGVVSDTPFQRQGVPFFIALCGAPGSGKTTVAELLVERYGARLIDDGLPLRLACMALYNLSWDDVSTAAGKDRLVLVGDQEVTVRQLLGWSGDDLEERWGTQILADMALQKTYEMRGNIFVFPSVRKDQGKAYRRAGGMVIEVDRPGHLPVNAFDFWDKSAVTCTLLNNGSLEVLRTLAIALFDFHLEPVS